MCDPREERAGTVSGEGGSRKCSLLFSHRAATKPVDTGERAAEMRAVLDKAIMLVVLHYPDGQGCPKSLRRFGEIFPSVYCVTRYVLLALRQNRLWSLVPRFRGPKVL